MDLDIMKEINDNQANDLGDLFGDDVIEDDPPPAPPAMDTSAPGQLELTAQGQSGFANISKIQSPGGAMPPPPMDDDIHSPPMDVPSPIGGDDDVGGPGSYIPPPTPNDYRMLRE